VSRWRLLGLSLLAASLLLCPPSSWAQNAADTRREIKDRLVEMLRQYEQASRDTVRLQGELAVMENNLAREQQEAARLALRQAEMGERLAGARAEEANMRARLQVSRERYRRQVRLLYLVGVESDLGLLASDQDYRAMLERSQALTWLLAAQHQRLGDLQTARRELTRAQGELALQQNQIDEVRGNLLATRARQEELHQRRARLLARLEQHRLGLIERISALREAEARLAQAFALPPLPSDAQGGRALGVREAQGGLSAPVQGKVLSRAGDSRLPGIFIAAAPGAPVRAPWDGWVVFADNLAHLGKVVVIDHGEKVHTVLGGLGTLAVGMGQQIDQGERLGTLGPGGDLYLEVRLEAEAQDPRVWLRLDY
jgi:septal ring factor EnvC (AmiA/AmiB activator)